MQHHLYLAAVGTRFMAISIRSPISLFVGLLLLFTFHASDGIGSGNLPLGSQELAKKIDKQFVELWREAGVEPAEYTTDAEFLRRVYLDVAGHIPTVAEVRIFLADSSLDKREKIISRLLASDAHNRHMATFWRRAWIPQADTPQFADRAQHLEDWIREQLRQDAGYDRIVFQLLTAVDHRVVREKTSVPTSLFDVARNQPEELAANNLRAFAGISISCAQCHDDPFLAWTQNQFWRSAAFYVQPDFEKPVGLQSLSITIPHTSQRVYADFLTPYAVEFPERFDRNTGAKLMAQWITDPKNPFFADNVVNLVWKLYLGEALVANLTDDQNSIQREILDELATSFIASGMNLEYLCRTILETKVYQLSSRLPRGQAIANSSGLFSVAWVRALSGEQLYASLRLAAGFAPTRTDVGCRQESLRRRKFSEEFYIEEPLKTDRSMLQALQIMNGELTDPHEAPILLAIGNAEFLGHAQKIDTLFLAALGRSPSAEEHQWLVLNVNEAASNQPREDFLASLFWALIATSEFSTNH